MWVESLIKEGPDARLPGTGNGPQKQLGTGITFQKIAGILGLARIREYQAGIAKIEVTGTWDLGLKLTGNWDWGPPIMTLLKGALKEN